MTSACRPGTRTVEYALLAEELGFSRGLVSRDSRLRPRHMGHSRPHRRKGRKRIQIWPLRADPELSPSDGTGLGHRDARADRAGTPDGRVSATRLYGPCGDGQEALEPREHAHAYCAGLRHCCAATLPTSTAVSPRSSRPTAGCPIVRSTCQSTMAGQGPKARVLAKEITDGLISLGGPAEGFETLPRVDQRHGPR